MIYADLKSWSLFWLMWLKFNHHVKNVLGHKKCQSRDFEQNSFNVEKCHMGTNKTTTIMKVEEFSSPDQTCLI